ncbi:MAG: helix-turn-helix domain-containing protein [Blautia marasmi]
MSNAYDKMLNRLNAYRQMQNMSQENMGSVMGITQSHYSKLEKGKKIISGEELYNLKKNNIDVDYLISGRGSLRTVLDELMEQCSSKKRAELLQLIVWTVQQGMESAQIAGVRQRFYQGDRTSQVSGISSYLQADHLVQDPYGKRNDPE